MIRVPLEVLLALPKTDRSGLVLVLAVLGILLAIATWHIRDVAVPAHGGRARRQAAVVIAAAIWAPLVIAAAVDRRWARCGGPAAATQRRPGGRWPPKGDGEEAGLVITADTIVLALRHLPDPGAPQGLQGRVAARVPHAAGQGRPRLLRGVQPAARRHRRRCSPTSGPCSPGTCTAPRSRCGPRPPSRPGTPTAVWIADPGVLSRPAPEYPLLHEGTADVFKGVPGGVSPRGDGLVIPIVGNNFVVGGQMGQGKSNACRVVMLGCALDPLAELDVFVFANNGDFDAYAPRLARYVKGVEDDAVAAAVHRLHELYARGRAP